MSKKFLSPINLLSRETDPQNGLDGDIYFNSALKQIKLYSSSAWNAVTTASGGGGVSVLVSDTVPQSATSGSFWYESDSGDLFIYYDNFWVQVNNSGIDQNYIDATASAIGQRLTIANASATYLSIIDASTIYAPLISPGFTGIPTAPTASASISTTQIATTQFVSNAILDGGAP